jgi:hypothetical protein
MTRRGIGGAIIKSALSLVILAVSFPVSGAGRKTEPMDEKRLLVYGLIRQVEYRANNFEKVLKPSLKVSTYFGSSREHELVDRADNIKWGAMLMRDQFKRGQSSDDMRSEAGDLFVAAERLNLVVSNVSLPQPAVDEWSELRDALNNLGAVYGLKPLSTASYVS